MKKVLVVEDNPLNMEPVFEILKAVGFNARGAEDGKKPVGMSEKETYDLEIMDIPGMNGVETTRIIRSKPAYKNAPVIAMTAMRGDRERFKASGFDGYVPKPIHVSEFTKRLEK